MSIISYAQNFEDVMLWRALGHVERGFYIDVGAQHPIIDSVSKAFYDHGWRGIHVEPTPTYADLLRENRPDESVIQAAVSNRHGMVRVYEIPGGGLSTGIESIAHNYEQQGIPLREILVPSITLDDIFDKAKNREIHWLKIDVEGMERQVLAGWKRLSALPWIVVMESTIPCSPQENWEQWEPLLLKKGYRFVYFDGLNRFYLSPEHEDIAHAFHAPPNVFDGFMIEGNATSSFCQYLNGRHKEKEAELQQKIEKFHLELQSSHKQAEQISQESLTRMRELHDQLEIDQSENLHRKTEWLEKEKILMSLGQQSRDEAHQQAQTHLRELIERDRIAAEQFDALRREMAEQAEREAKEHAAQEQALNEKLAEATTRIERLHVEWTEREQTLIAGTELARNEAHQQAQAHLRELIERERVTTERLNTLRREMAEQADREAQTHLMQIQALGSELNSQHEVQHSLQARLSETAHELHSAHILEIQLRTEIAQTTKHAAGIATELARIKTSTSWKLTVPMRWLANIIWGQAAPSAAAILATQLPSGIATISSVPQHENNINLPILSPFPSDEAMGNKAERSGSPKQQSRTYTMNTIKHIDQLLELHGSEFIHATYRTLLGRDPDQKGALYYLGRLRAGYGKRSVISQIAKSKETKFRNVNLAGLDKLIRGEKFSKLWLWGWFKRTSRLEFQINRLDLMLASLEKEFESRIDSVEKKLDGINIRLMERTYPIVGNHQTTRDTRTTLPVDDTRRTSIVQGFKIPVECGASSLIAAIEKQVALSSEAAAFTTSNTDQSSDV